MSKNLNKLTTEELISALTFCDMEKNCHGCMFYDEEGVGCLGGLYSMAAMRLGDQAKTIEALVKKTTIGECAVADNRPINIKLHAQLCDYIKDLYVRKNHDYGDSFHDTYLEEGMAMSRIRLSDKLSRFKKLTRCGSQQVGDESIRDTLIDLANYAIMTVVEMDREERR